MKLVNPVTGSTYVRKLRRRYDVAGHARELTFSCFHRYRFLEKDRTRQWFIEALEEARREWRFELWAYVIMPEHVHLLVYPRFSEAISQTAPDMANAMAKSTPFEDSGRATPIGRGNARAKSGNRDPESLMGDILKAIKEPVAREAIKYLESNAPTWLARITVREGSRMRRRFWQPGGGYDRNLVEPSTAYQMIDYIHANPVRRGLVDRPENWEWSSARWYADIRPVPIEIDAPQIGSVGEP